MNVKLVTLSLTLGFIPGSNVGSDFEGVGVACPPDGPGKEVVVEAQEAMLTDECFNFCCGKAVRPAELVDCLFLLGLEECLNLGWIIRPHLLLLLLELPLCLGAMVRLDPVFPEVLEHLAWHFLESLLGQCHRVVSVTTEGHELHDVGCHVPVEALRVQGVVVSIEDVHS